MIDHIIVKVQMSLESNIPGQTKPGSFMLVYNESRSFKLEREPDKCIIGKMLGRPKAFFYATKEDKGNGHVQLIIHGEAPWQNW